MNIIEEKIEKIVNPILFLFKLVSHKNEIDDMNMSIILRLFLKHHFIIAQEYNIKIIFNNELNNYPSSLSVITNFYKYVKKLYSLTFNLKKYYENYNNKKFWKYNLSEQIDYLEKLKIHFFGIFDCSKGGAPYHIKLISLAKENKITTFIKDNIIERLILILKIFGAKLFNLLNIPIMTIEIFNDLTDEEIVQYLNLIYTKFSELLEETINLFNTFNIVKNNLNNLLNPSTLIINNISQYYDIDNIDEFFI